MASLREFSPPSAYSGVNRELYLFCIVIWILCCCHVKVSLLQLDFEYLSPLSGFSSFSSSLPYPFLCGIRRQVSLFIKELLKSREKRFALCFKQENFILLWVNKRLNPITLFCAWHLKLWVDFKKRLLFLIFEGYRIRNKYF